VYAQDLSEGVSCGNVLNNIKNQQILVSVINTTDTPVTIDIPSLENLSYDVINEATIMTTKNVNQETLNPSNRIQKLKESLRMNEQSAIQDLCCEFADIFHL